MLKYDNFLRLADLSVESCLKTLVVVVLSYHLKYPTILPAAFFLLISLVRKRYPRCLLLIRPFAGISPIMSMSHFFCPQVSFRKSNDTADIMYRSGLSGGAPRNKVVCFNKNAQAVAKQWSALAKNNSNIYIYIYTLSITQNSELEKNV